MNQRSNWNRIAQWVVVLLCAFGLKSYYSTASVDELRWILAPTKALVEVVSGESFEFESHAGYMNEDRSFLIAASCAGVNFLITAFLMLSIRKLLRDRSRSIEWRFIPAAGLIAYLVTLAANTVRISVAIPLHRMPSQTAWLNPDQLHRLEGIAIYFGFLLLLFVVSEGAGSVENPRALRQTLFPLLVYYATTLGIPLANGAYRRGSDFWEHTLFLLIIPPMMILPLTAFRFFRPGRFPVTKHIEQTPDA